MPLTRKRLLVRGRVQGVGFRWFSADAAARHGVTGWVRNRRDGAVEAEAQGDAAAVDAFVAELRRGPRFASVESLEESPLAPIRGEPRFEVRSGEA